FKCKFCFLYFTSKSYLNDHLIEKHSLPNRQGKNKRKSGSGGVAAQNGSTAEPPVKMGCISEQQLNSTLQLNPRTSIDAAICSSKRAKGTSNVQPNHHQQNHVQQQQQMEESSAADINELFQQLVGETLG